MPTLTPWLPLPPGTQVRTLSADDLRRLDSYAGTGDDLHTLLPTVLPLATPMWWSAAVTAQGGTEMVLGYLAEPDGADAIRVSASAKLGNAIASVTSPVRLTADALTRPDGLSAAQWREARVTAGIVIRALLLDLGTPLED